MSAPKKEQLKNNGVTTLNGALDNVSISFDVTDASVLPADGNFRLRIGDEILLVHAVSGNTLTAFRGQEGSSAGSHADGTTCRAVLTAGALGRFGLDNDSLWGTDRPAINRLVNDSGVEMLLADFDSVNFSSGTNAVGADDNGSIVLEVKDTGNWCLLSHTRDDAISTFIAAIECFGLSDSDAQNVMGAVGVRNSTTGHMVLMAYGANSDGSFPDLWNLAPTGFTDMPSATWTKAIAFLTRPTFWVKLVLTSGNVAFFVSNDGTNWVTGPSVSDSSADKIVIGGFNDSAGTELYVRLVHFSRVS